VSAVKKRSVVQEERAPFQEERAPYVAVVVYSVSPI